MKIRSFTERIGPRAQCEQCGELPTPTAAAARQHLRENPTHEVSMTYSAQVTFLTRPADPN